MVSEHDNFVLTAFKVMPPILEGLNDSQELSIVSFIPSLSRKHLSGKVESSEVS